MKKHIKQVAAWGKLSGLCNALGDSYKPSKGSMRSTAMENLLHESQVQIAAVHNAETFLANAISERKAVFDQIPGLATRVIAALEATGASLERINDVNAIRKRFRYQAMPNGREALPKEVIARKTGSGRQAEQDNADTSNQSAKHRVTYGDFNSKLNNFEIFISQLAQGSPYEPLEEELTITGLKKFSCTLKQKNENVAQAQLTLYQERQKRDALLFGTNGMHNYARMIKKYVRSVYGFKSIEFKTIRKVKFQK